MTSDTSSIRKRLLVVTPEAGAVCDLGLLRAVPLAAEPDWIAALTDVGVIAVEGTWQAVNTTTVALPPRPSAERK
jgi:hypothetical protein